MLEYREKRAEDARLGRSDAAIASQKKQERIKKQHDQMMKTLKEQHESREEHYTQVMREKEKDRQKSIIIRKLKEEEKVETAKRLERQRQKRMDELKNKFEQNMAYVEKIQEERRSVHAERMNLLSQLDKQKQDMQSNFNSLRVSGRTDMRQIKKLADLYDIDLNVIEMKAESRYPSRARTALSSARRSQSVNSRRSMF